MGQLKKKVEFETDLPLQEIDFSKVFQDVLYHYQTVRSISIQEKEATSFLCQMGSCKLAQSRHWGFERQQHFRKSALATQVVLHQG